MKALNGTTKVDIIPSRFIYIIFVCISPISSLIPTTIPNYVMCIALHNNCLSFAFLGISMYIAFNGNFILYIGISMYRAFLFEYLCKQITLNSLHQYF